jgi:hypothetical protein
MTLLGLLGTALFVMYSLGQFVNGQLGDKLGARRLVLTAEAELKSGEIPQIQVGVKIVIELPGLTDADGT